MKKLQTQTGAALLASLLCLMSPQLQADQTEIDALKLQLQALTERLQQLEASANQASTATAPSTATPSVIFSGLMEIEASDSDHDSNGRSSDLVVATVELGIEALLSERINTAITLLYEEDDTDLEVDMAVISIANLADTGISLTLGQTYLPFGAFDTFLVNDTLILELAESRETAAMINWSRNGLGVSAYLFNGDIDEHSDNLENFGASLVWRHVDVNLGLDYISNILDSDGLSAAIEDDGVDLSTLEAASAGYIFRASTQIGRVVLLSEYLQAESFSSGRFVDRQLDVIHLEAATNLGPWSLALAWQESDDAESILPEERLSLGASTRLMDHLGLGVELWHDNDFNGEESNNLLVQLNLEF